MPINDIRDIKMSGQMLPVSPSDWVGVPRLMLQGETEKDGRPLIVSASRTGEDWERRGSERGQMD